MTDATSLFARWRLCLREFDFTVHYKTGAKNTIEDCISRLPTFVEANTTPDVTIPCLSVEELYEQYPFEGIDLDYFYDELLGANVEQADINDVEEASIIPVTNEELVTAQFLTHLMSCRARRISEGREVLDCRER